MDAVDRDIVPLDDDQTVMGIDVARFGDDKSIILVKQGGVVTGIHEFSKLDTEQLSGWAMGLIHELEPRFVMADSIGIGAGVADKLRHRTNCEIIDINVAESPTDKYKFHGLRDELWWKAREGFEKKIVSIPNDEELIAQLTTPKYDMPNGRIKVESKKEMKKRGLKSPDKADAYCLAGHFDNEMIRRMSAPKRRRNPEPLSSWKVV